MRTAKKLSGLAIASAAAAIFAMTPMIASAEMAKGDVKCAGINGCKGQGACGSKTNACAGQNSCKGQGWVKVSAEECTEKGGTVAE